MAVKIKLKRMGKIRAPYYRIVVADARTKRDGRAIEEIGKYHPKVEPSLIEVNSERAQYWLSVGAQPTSPVRRIFEITGDWQKFKGLPGAEGTLKTAAAQPDKKEAFAAALAETLKDKGKADGSKTDKGRARKSGATSAAADSPKGAAGESDKAARTGGKQAGGGRKAKDAPARGAAASQSAATEPGMNDEGKAKQAPAKGGSAQRGPAGQGGHKDTSAKESAASQSTAASRGSEPMAADSAAGRDGEA